MLGDFGPEPELFVFFNPDGYGPESGYVNNQNHRGSSFSMGLGGLPEGRSGTSAAPTAPQVGFVMEWVLDDSGWVLYMDGGDGNPSGVGYFPKEYYSGGLANGAGFSFG